MKARYKRKRPKLSNMSMTPSVFLTNEAARNMNAFANDYPKRLKRGRELFLLAAAEIIRDEVERKAPEIGGYDYAKDLEVAVVPGFPGNQAVAVVHKQSRSYLLEQDVDRTLLVFSYTRSSRRYMEAMISWQPWPASLVPVKFDDDEAGTIGRIASAAAYRREYDRIIRNKSLIESELRAQGLKGARVVPAKKTVGLGFQEDLAFSVMRKEFGIETNQVAHWRPAIREMVKKLQGLADKFVKFVETGSERVFDVPRHIEAKKEVLDKSSRFTTKIASGVSIPKKVKV